VRTTRRLIVPTRVHQISQPGARRLAIFNFVDSWTNLLLVGHFSLADVLESLLALHPTCCPSTGVDSFHPHSEATTYRPVIANSDLMAKIVELLDSASSAKQHPIAPRWAASLFTRIIRVSPDVVFVGRRKGYRKLFECSKSKSRIPAPCHKQLIAFKKFS